MTAKPLMERVEARRLLRLYPNETLEGRNLDITTKWREGVNDGLNIAITEILKFAGEVRAMKRAVLNDLDSNDLDRDTALNRQAKRCFGDERMSLLGAATAYNRILAMLGAEKGGRPCEARSPVQGVAHEVSAEQAEDVSDRPAEPDSRPSESPERGGKGKCEVKR